MYTLCSPSIIKLMIIENRALCLARSFALSRYNHREGIITLKASSFQNRSPIPRAQWNGTFRLHRPDPSHSALGYCYAPINVKPARGGGGGGGRAWGGDLIVFVVPGVGHLTDLVLPGGGDI